MSDNRNGTVISSNADVFLFKSINGGSTWIGPTRVNNDRSLLTAGTDILGNQGRDCLRPPGSIGFETIPPQFVGPCAGDFGNDQWWPWVDTNDFGHLNVIFHDRRLDLDSQAHEWPTSRNRPGNYLVSTWGGAVRGQAGRLARVPRPLVRWRFLSRPRPSIQVLIRFRVRARRSSAA